MKIGCVLSQFPRYDETFILRELKALHDAGEDVRIFSLRRCNDDIVHNDAEPLIPKTTYLPWFLSVSAWAAWYGWLLRKPGTVARLYLYVLRGAFRSPWQTLKNLLVMPKAFACAAEWECDPPDVVHGLWATFPATAAKVIGDCLGKPWTFAAHAHDIFTSNPLLLDNLRDAKLVMTCTGYNVEHLSERVPEAAAHVHLVHHGLSLERFSPSMREAAPGELRLLSVGSLFVCKGYPALFETVRQLVESGVNVHCRIVGDGPERNKLEDLAGQLGIDERVEFSGFATQEEMPEHYRWADVFALLAVPEIHWGIPNVVLEAMACELPVAVTGLPSLTRVFDPHEVAAFLPMTTDDDRIRAAAAILHSLADDPERRRRIGMAARRKVGELFDTPRCAARMIELFREVSA